MNKFAALVGLMFTFVINLFDKRNIFHIRGYTKLWWVWNRTN